MWIHRELIPLPVQVILSDEPEDDLPF